MLSPLEKNKSILSPEISSATFKGKLIILEVHHKKEFLNKINIEIQDEVKNVTKIRDEVKEMENEYCQKGLNVREIIKKDFNRFR